MKKISKRIIISAGIVPVRFENRQPLFLLLEHKGYWDFPKGKQEDGENIFDTAMRETQEETTLVEGDLNFKWGKVNKTSDKYKRKPKYATYFIAETEVKEIGLPVNPEIGRPEHESYAWLTYEEAKSILTDRVSKILDWANEIVAD